jgi:hypothetical protein
MQVFVQDVYMYRPVGVKLGLSPSKGKTKIKVGRVHSSEENIWTQEIRERGNLHNEELRSTLVHFT